MVGTGSAVSPVSPLLVCARVSGTTDPTIVPSRRSKGISVSRQAWFYDRACFGRSFPGRHQIKRVTQMLRPVSQTTGISAGPHI